VLIKLQRSFLFVLFEVIRLICCRSIEVGICEVDVKTSTLEECDFRKTYTYRQDGSKFNNLTGISEPFGPTFGNGDVIGCGWNKSDDQCNNFIHIFFTHNGKFIGSFFLQKSFFKRFLSITLSTIRSFKFLIRSPKVIFE
jgi:hypothetical protein